MDPISGIRFKRKSESFQRKIHLSRSHVLFAQSNRYSLGKQSVPDHTIMQAENAAAFSPDMHIEIVRANMARIRDMAQSLWSVTLERRAHMPEHIRRVHEATSDQGIHIALLEAILVDTKFPAEETSSLIRHMQEGFPLVGDIPVSFRAGEGEVTSVTITEQDLVNRADEIRSNIRKSLSSSKTDSDLAEEVWKQTFEDAEKGRMSIPEPLDNQGFAPTKRFAIRQQSSSGKEKVRIIDDFAQSLVNDMCDIYGRIRMGRIQDLIQVTRILLCSQFDEPLGFCKADFQSAYRNCPIRSEHLQFAKVTFKDTFSNEFLQSVHYCMPFGAIAAVYAWDRLAEAVQWAIASTILLPVSRYVDDLFSPTFLKYKEEIQSFFIEFGQLVGIIIDPKKTPIPSEEETILGVTVKLKKSWRRNEMRGVIHTILEEKKAVFWREQILEALKNNRLSNLQAQKIAGRLNFAASAAVGMSGHSRLRQIYKHSFSSSPVISTELANELVWWANRLNNQKPSQFPVGPNEDRVCILYTDAEGTGGVGGILFTPSKSMWFKGFVDHSRLGLSERHTQIIPLETCAVAIAIRVWRSELGGCRLIAFVDNQSALGALKKGRSAQDDIQRLVDATVEDLESLHSRPAFLWVPSCLNPADFPSRGLSPFELMPDLFQSNSEVDASRAILSMYV